VSAVQLPGEASRRTPQQQVSVLASAGVRQRHLPTAPDRVTGAEPTNDDTAAGVPTVIIR